MAGRIIQSSTAFSIGKANRMTGGRPQVKLVKHRAWVKKLPSLITGKRGTVEVAHISLVDPTVGKTGRGYGKKEDDYWVVPLSLVLHNESHDFGERAFMKKYDLDLVKIALGLFHCSGDDEAGELIVSQTIRKVQS